MSGAGALPGVSVRAWFVRLLGCTIASGCLARCRAINTELTNGFFQFKSEGCLSTILSVAAVKLSNNSIYIWKIIGELDESYVHRTRHNRTNYQVGLGPLGGVSFSCLKTCCASVTRAAQLLTGFPCVGAHLHGGLVQPTNEAFVFCNQFLARRRALRQQGVLQCYGVALLLWVWVTNTLSNF